MSLYLILDLCVIIPTFLFSFDKKIRFYRKFPALFFAILWGGGMFVFWDIIATARGDWGFNPHYVSGVRWLGLPLEELLFFIVVPYSCFFIYEVICYFKKDQLSPPRDWLFISLAIVSFLISWLNHDRAYTATVFGIMGLFFLVAIVFCPMVLRSRNYWLFIVISFIPFLIMNYILTALPVVVYNPLAVMGKRFLTIPVEDFFYSFSLLSFCFMVYSFGQGRFRENMISWLLMKGRKP